MSGPKKPILCLDFDGVLHSYSSGWQGAAAIPDPPVPGAIAFLWSVIEHFDVQILSSRSHQPGGIDAMREWLAKWDGEFWADKPGRPRTALVLCVKFPTEKPPALVTLDDRALTFIGTFPSIESLTSFRPWNHPNRPCHDMQSPAYPVITPSGDVSWDLKPNGALIEGDSGTFTTSDGKSIKLGRWTAYAPYDENP